MGKGGVHTTLATKGIARGSNRVARQFAVYDINTVLFYMLKDALLILSDSRSARTGNVYGGNNLVTDSKHGKGILSLPQFPHILIIDSCLKFASLVFS